MQRQPFTLDDLIRECEVESGHRQLDGRPLGLRIRVPEALWQRYPYNATAYAFLQQLRGAIHEYGLVEFPDLPVNPTNHTLAQRAPWQHGYSTNPYMTDHWQHPHQDTPPHPTAFWLGGPRHFFATWVVSQQGLEAWQHQLASQREGGLAEAHRHCVPASVADGTGWLINRQPGLVLLDNSEACRLYHARTRVAEPPAESEQAEDEPMYAYNETGLLHYIDQLDSRRGTEHRCPRDRAEVEAFLAAEGRSG